MKGVIEEEEGVAPSRRKGMVSFGEELVRQPCWYEYGITDIQKPVRDCHCRSFKRGKTGTARDPALQANDMVRPAPLLMLCLALSFSTTLAQTVTPYFKQATDTCTDGGGDSGGSKIATTAACKAAASMWNGEPGPKSVGITEVDLSDEPAGCIATNFAKTGMTVRFNSNADTVVKCSAGTVCLCSYTKGCPTNTRPPSEMPNGWVSGPCEMTGTGGRGASIKTCGDSTCSGCGAGQYRPLETTDTGCLTCAEGKCVDHDYLPARNQNVFPVRSRIFQWLPLL